MDNTVLNCIVTYNTVHKNQITRNINNMLFIRHVVFFVLVRWSINWTHSCKRGYIRHRSHMIQICCIQGSDSMSQYRYLASLRFMKITFSKKNHTDLEPYLSNVVLDTKSQTLFAELWKSHWKYNNTINIE